MGEFNPSSLTNLFSVFSSLNSVDDCRAFLEDLCTIKELQDMAQRFETVLLLNKGISYNEISSELGVSTTTITRVNRCLNYGSGGYKKALKVLSESENKNANK